MVGYPGNQHPFLLVCRSEFGDLQARAEDMPWKQQKQVALDVAWSFRDDLDAEIRSRSIDLARALSLTALAYILDPAARSVYSERIVGLIGAFDTSRPGNLTTQMRANVDKTLWTHAVPTGNAFFQAVLALDVVHDDLSPRDLRDCESILRDGPARYFAQTRLAWYQGTWASWAIWPLYERDAAVYTPVVQAWRQDVHDSISADGVFTGGTGYATARWTSPDRENKAIFGDVLAHSGVLPGWYQDPQIRNFQEWLNGYSHTPFRVAWTFGDSAPSRFNEAQFTATERAYRYTECAGRYGAWLNEGKIPNALLSTYALTDRFPIEPKSSPSRIFADGGAWLKEPSLDPLSLSGALLNLRSVSDGHPHKETNSLGLAAYGELLLRAAGYNGYATAEKGFSWEYIHHRALSANVALFDYPLPETPAEERDPSPTNDHQLPTGLGITSSLLSERFDSAAGDSGSAIPNGRHRRQFMFIHPADGAGGYFATVDALQAYRPGASALLVWHPAAETYTEVTRDQECTWRVKEFSQAGAQLTLFLATEPTGTSSHDGVLANWGKGIVGKYLAGHYDTDYSGYRQVVTVLFPHNDQHQKASFARMNVDGLTGAVVRQGDVVDYLYESGGVDQVQPEDGVRIQARAGFHRRAADGTLLSCWLADACSFVVDGDTFHSDAPVTLARSAGSLRLEAQVPTEIRLSRTGLMSVRINGISTVVSVDGGVGSFAVTVPAGTHEIELHG